VISNIRVDYSLNKKWTVGLAYSPVGSHRVEGREIPIVAGRVSDPTELAAEYSGHTLAVTASVFAAPDLLLKKSTVRVSAGIGVGRIKTSVRDGARYALHADTRASQEIVPAIVANVDWIRFFNRTVSLNVGVQYRYIPFSYDVPTGEKQGWDAISLVIPKKTLNAGGIGFGIGVGFHW
jgi:hypothetical protein